MVAILILIPIFLFSFSNASSGWQPRAFGDPTPTGTILKVTTTHDHKILVGLGQFSPSTEYKFCDILLVPPGEHGGYSAGNAKLLKINDQGYGPYNSTIHLEILPSQSSDNPNFVSGHIRENDVIIINSSLAGHIPEGRWTIFLMFLEGPMTSATWIVGSAQSSDQSL